MVVLLPMQHSHLKLELVGPYEVVKKVTPVDYEVNTSQSQGEKATMSTF